MADEPKTEAYKRPPRGEGQQPSMPIALVASLITAIVAGGGGSYMTGSSVSATLRESMVRVEGQVQALRDEVRNGRDDQRAAMQRQEAEYRAGLLRLDGRDNALDERLRALERATPAPR